VTLLRTLVLGLFGGPALAAAPDPCALALRLDARVVAATGDPPAAGCPAFGAGLPAAAGLRSQAGAFDPATGLIHLAPDIDLATPWGQSVLLHELVHAAQARGGRLAACEGALEAEAYRLQADFLRGEGADREARMVTALAALLGTCN
jgi:hypothetical protein